MSIRTTRPLTREELADHLGAGIHTGLRKAASSAWAQKAWEAISYLPDDEWEAALLFAIDGMTISGLFEAASS